MRSTEPAGTGAFHAFISYSHAADGRLAPALQHALQRFAKPWYRIRALRVFRDETTLSATPHLWSSIRQALAASEHFVLLASPDAARSPWVGHEIDFWREHKPLDTLLLAVTDGEVFWDSAANDFDWERSTAISRSLQGAYAEEPRWIDLRWARGRDDLSLSHSRFREAVAELAAPIHGKPKDELAGEEVRQHRRTIRIARAAGALLVVLLAAACVLAFFALQQRNSARRAARVDRAGRLAATALSLGRTQPDVALLTAIEALRTDDSVDARSAFAAVLEQRHGRIVGIPQTSPIGFSGDGRFFALHVAAGEVQVRRARDGVLVWRDSSESSQTADTPAGSVSTDGKRVALPISAPQLSVYSPSGKVTFVPGTDDDRLLGTAFLRSAGDRRIVAVTQRVKFPERVVTGLRVDTWDLATRRRTATFELPPSAGDVFNLTATALSGDGARVAVLDRAGAVHVRETQTGREVRKLELGPGAIDLDDAGRRLAWRGRDGKIRFVDLARGAVVHATGPPARARGEVGIVLSGDGKRAVDWWAPTDGPDTAGTQLRTLDVDAIAQHRRWTPAVFTQRPSHEPLLDRSGERLLTRPAFRDPTVLTGPEPIRALTEGLAVGGLGPAVAVGHGPRASRSRVRGVTVLRDPRVKNDRGAAVEALPGARARVVQDHVGAPGLEVLDLPGGARRLLVAPPNELTVFVVGLPVADAVVGWDISCHFCGLGRLYVWDARTGKPRGEPIGGEKIPLGPVAPQYGGVEGVVAVRVDGDRLVAAVVDVGRKDGRRDLLLIDPATGTLRRRLHGVGPVSASGPVAVSPSGGRIAVAAPNGGVAVIDTRTGRTIVPPLSPLGVEPARALGFAGEDRLVVGYGTSLLAIDVPARHVIGTGSALRAPATDIVADPAGRRVLVRIEQYGPNALVEVPDALLAGGSVDDLAQAGCATLGRNLTEAEWETLFAGRKRRSTCPSLPPDDPGLTPIHLSGG